MALEQSAHSFIAAMKEIYPQDVLKNLVYQKNPFLALVDKEEDLSGKSYIVPLIISNPQATSATFAQAVANKGSSVLEKFAVTVVKDYALASIDNLTIEASKSNRGAFISAAKMEVDNAMRQLANRLGQGLFGNGGGAIGVIGTGSVVGSKDITLATTADAVKFEKGMVLKTALTDGTSSTVRSGSVTVDKVDRDTGVITATANWSAGITAPCAVGDYIFVDGDFGLRMSGLAAWLPSTAPSASESFFGLDRSYDPVRLAGSRVSSSQIGGLPLEEKLLFGATKVAREGGAPDTIVVSFETYRDLAVQLGSKVMYVNIKNEDVQVGFEGIKIVGAGTGPITVIADRNCPATKAYVLQLDTWRLISVGAAPHILDGDAFMLREAASDAYEVRIAAYCNLVCVAPGWNGVVDLS